MYQYGLKLVHDEQGYPVLLSFAQAGNHCNPVNIDACIDNRDFAMMHAENSAFAFIAEAYNLNGRQQIETTNGITTTRNAAVAMSSTGEDTIETTVDKILKETEQLSKMTSNVKTLSVLKRRCVGQRNTLFQDMKLMALCWHGILCVSARFAHLSEVHDLKPKYRVNPKPPSG